MAFPPWPDLGADELERRQLALWKEEDLFRRTLEANRERAAVRLLRGSADGQRPAGHPSRLRPDDQGPGLPLPRDAGASPSPASPAGTPTACRSRSRSRRSSSSTARRRSRSSACASSTPGPGRASSSTRRSGSRSPTGSGTGSTTSTPTSPAATTTSRRCGGCSRGCTSATCSTAGTGCCPYCPRCGTVLSSHELAQGYEDVTTNSIYVTFPLDERLRRASSWSGPRRRGRCLQRRGRRCIRSSSTASTRWADRAHHPGDRRGRRCRAAPSKGAPRFAELGARRTFPGRELVGLRYRRPLDVVPLPEDRASRIVVAGRLRHRGRRLRHRAHGAGVRRRRLQRRAASTGSRWSARSAADGTFTGTTWPEIEGRLVTDEETNDLIIQRLKQDGRLASRPSRTPTRYPHCWRCASPLIYYARDSWFVRTSAVKERMLEINRAGGLASARGGRGPVRRVAGEQRGLGALARPLLGHAAAGLGLRSRSRARRGRSAATPVWRSGGASRCRPTSIRTSRSSTSYTWACACGGTMRRAPEVIDAWFDSGAMPYAQWHYPFENAGGVRRPLPGRLHLRGRGPDARVVLLAAGDRDRRRSTARPTGTSS